MDQKTTRILTGHRPTGPRHIGHLIGTLQNWASMQDSHQCFFLIADLHVLTTDFEHPERIQVNTLEMVIDWLAAGIDPGRATIILQSAVPEHTLLSTLLSMLVTVGRLQRVPTYKEQVQALHLTPSLGLLSYPVLQAADILIYQADAVPVGEDQLPHIEVTRELARRFNTQYGAFFPEPEAILSSCPRLPGTDNRTMHTSFGNSILLRDTPEETHRKIMGMYTDPTRLHASDPGHVEGNPVFTYLDIFDPDKELVGEMKLKYRQGQIGDVSVKQHLSRVMNKALEAHRQRRAEISLRPDLIFEMIHAGTIRARQIARQTVEHVMDKMGLRIGQSLSDAYLLGQSTSLEGPGC